MQIWQNFRLYLLAGALADELSGEDALEAKNSSHNSLKIRLLKFCLNLPGADEELTGALSGADALEAKN